MLGMNGPVPIGVLTHVLQAGTPTGAPPPNGLGAGLAAGILLLVLYLVVVLLVVVGGAVVVLAVRRGHLFGVELNRWQHGLFVASGAGLVLGLVVTALATGIGALLLGSGVLALLAGLGWVVVEAVQGRFGG